MAAPPLATAAPQTAPADSEVYTLKGLYYQVLGHAWDHELKDFQVVYRPLYHCDAKAGRFEAHTLAVSRFSRWERRFVRVDDLDTLPDAVRALLLDGPFTLDPRWTLDARASLAAAPTRSGLGSRSHEPSAVVTIDDIIGNWRGFVGELHAGLVAVGIDGLARGYEMDHICYRTSTAEEYLRMKRQLVPHHGSVAIEGMIGGRPILTVALHVPLVHPLGFTIAAIELPAPKAGSPYPSGLEHAELVVGEPEDGVAGSEAVVRFVAECEAAGLGLVFSTRALRKEVNADVSLGLELSGGVAASVKFHAQPLLAVVEYERAHGACDPVPAGYFAGAAEAGGGGGAEEGARAEVVRLTYEVARLRRELEASRAASRS